MVNNRGVNWRDEYVWKNEDRTAWFDESEWKAIVEE